MSLRRILKTGGSLMSAQGINVVTQFLLPPIFLHSYGVAGYGEWLTLSAAVGYLSTLNFGLHTYTNNQVAICYNRGELEEAGTVQATAVLLLISIVLVAMAITSIVFLLPVDLWLGIKLSRTTVNATLYLLGLQILFKLVLGFITGTFLVVGTFHRGANWNNAHWLSSTLVTAVAAFLHASFVLIAGIQAVLAVSFCAFAGIDLRRVAPLLVPRLRCARLDRAVEILKQSGYFGIIFWSSFLVFQLPLILMQRMLGPSTVVVFSVTRTIFSMPRQALTAMTQTLSQEITELYGRHQWDQLHRLYDLSERVVLVAIPLVSMGTLLTAPVLIAIWLHNPALYDPYMCILMALVSATMAIKEHKYQFQVATNQHTILARITLWSYLGMTALAVAGIHLLGPIGFLIPWLVTESIQVILIIRLNRRLFAGRFRLDFLPVYKLFALMVFAVMLIFRFAIHAQQRPLLQTAFIATVFLAALVAICFPLFGFTEVQGYLRDRISEYAGKFD